MKLRGNLCRKGKEIWTKAEKIEWFQHRWYVPKAATVQKWGPTTSDNYLLTPKDCRPARSKFKMNLFRPGRAREKKKEIWYNVLWVIGVNLWWGINDGYVGPTRMSSFLAFIMNHSLTTTVSPTIQNTLKKNSEETGQKTETNRWWRKWEVKILNRLSQ